MVDGEKRIALLIDAANAPASTIDVILELSNLIAATGLFEVPRQNQIVLIRDKRKAERARCRNRISRRGSHP